MSHIHEKIDFTVGVFIVNQGKVLLRMHDKYGIWMGVGGHVELDEDPLQAAIREAKEESGLDVIIVGEKTKVSDFHDGYTELFVPRFLYRHKINDSHTHINSIYFATTNSDVLAPAEDEARVEMRWFTKEDLQDPRYKITDTMKFFAEEALKALS